MHNTVLDNPTGRVAFLPPVIGLFCAALAALAIAGWTFDVHGLRSLGEGLFPVQPLAAAWMFLLGLALTIISGEWEGLRRFVGVSICLAVGVAAALVVAEHLTGADLLIDRSLFPDRLTSEAEIVQGRPPLESAILTLLLSFAFATVRLSLRPVSLAGQVSAILVMLVALLAVILYVFGVTEFRLVPLFSYISLYEAIGFFLLSFGILIEKGNEGVFAVFWSDGTGGIFARRMFPFVVLLPVVVGWLRQQGELAGYYPTVYGITIVTLVTIIGFAGLTWLIARSIDRHERDRRSAQRDNDRQAMLIRQSFEPIFVWDMEDGILEWNPGCEKLYGYKESEVHGRMGYEVLRSEYPLPREQFLERLKNDRWWSGEVIQHKQDGTRVISESRFQVIESDGRLLVLQTNRDMTERKRFERELVAERDFSENAINSLPGVVYLFNSAGKYIRWNENLERISGYTGAEIADMHPLGFFRGEDRDRVEKAIGVVFEKGRAQVVADLISKDGTATPYFFTGNQIIVDGEICLIGMGIDVTEQQRAQKMLQESEARYKLLFENNPFPMWVYELETLRFTAVNDSAVKRYGYSREEFLSMTIEDIRPPEDIERLRENVRKTDEEIANSGPWRHRLKDGTIIEVEITSHTLELDGVESRLVLANDVTERNDAVRRLQSNERLFRNIFNQQYQFMAILSPDGRVREINELPLRMTGYSRAEFVGHLFWETPPWLEIENAQQRWQEHLERAANTREPVVSDDIYMTSQGVLRNYESATSAVFDQEGNVEYFVLQGTDTTDKRAAEAKLSESERQFRTMFEFASVGIFQANTQTGRLQLFNKKFCEITGYSPDELHEKPVSDLTHPEDREADLELFSSASQGRTPQYINEKRLVRRDGSVVWVRMNATFIRDESGKPVRTMAAVEDITERKRAEDELIELNAMLENRVAERTLELAAVNKELESFSYSVSHDLRAPLRAMDGFSQALIEDYGEVLDETGIEYLDRIRAGSQHMARLIEDMLKLSRVTRSELYREPVDLAAIAQEISERLKNADPSREAEFVVDEAIKANCDERLVRIALENLMENAWKFTRKRDQARIEVGISQNGGRPEIYVRDNGAGFDMAYAGKLFGAFQRLHRQDEFEGIGIGLATVQRIVHMHGGRIRAESKPGEGAAFYFTLN